MQLSTENSFMRLRQEMVDTQLRNRDITDARVLTAMEKIPRHLFVRQDLRHYAYFDRPLPIGEDQTISQPYIVAFMTQLLQLKGHEIVLEVGAGSGYQTAVLCELAHYIYSLERFRRLGSMAAQRLHDLGYRNVDIHIGDGSQGLPDMQPFDAIIVTAAAPSLPGSIDFTVESQRRSPGRPGGRQRTATVAAG